MKLVKYFLYTSLFSIAILIAVFFNLGNFLDVSSNAKPSDIIVCLGGGEEGRIQKAVALYEKAYATSNILILTGDDRSKKNKDLDVYDNRIKYIKDNNFTTPNIVDYKQVGNTKGEILFIKRYMLEQNFTSAIIVSDAPHTRRIQTLISLIDIENDDKLHFTIVASDVDWWDSDRYYDTKKAKAFAFREAIKLVYSYVAYGFLEKVGLFPMVKELTHPVYTYVKKEIDKKTYFYLKEKK